MGAAGSVRRSPASMQAEIERLRSKEMDLMEENDKQLRITQLKHEAEVTQLENEKFSLAENLREAQTKLSAQTEKWKKEQAKALSLMFSHLPLNLLQSKDCGLQNIETSSIMTRTFQIVTVAQCDVAGFSSLSARLPPAQVVQVIDRLHAIIDEAFTDSDVFVMERSSDGCIAACGLVDYQEEKLTPTPTPVSMTDSSYGSEIDLEFTNEANGIKEKCTIASQAPSYYAEKLASAALRLLSYSTSIAVPLPENQTLQLRIALHSGPCSAGVIGLQTNTGTSRTPHYKLFGPTVRHLQILCSSSLALQIRVSKPFKDLLVRTGGFVLERCPDYMLLSSQKPIESYWLVGKEDLPLKLPSLNDAIPLCNYHDTMET